VRLSLITLALGASLGLASGALAQQAPAAPSKPATPTSPWKGGAVADPSGKFGYCVAESRFDNKLALVIARNPNGETNIAVGIPGAKMTKGESFPVNLRIDQTITRTFKALVVEADLLVIPTGKDDQLYEAMRKGSGLFLEGPKDSTAFQLKGTSKALGDLKECVQTAGASTKSAKPDGAGKDAASNPLPETLRAILAAAGLREITPLSMANVPPEKRPADYAWKLGPIFGGVREAVVPADADFGKLTDAYIDALKQRCPNDFTPDPKAAEKLAKATVRTATVTCNAPDGKINVAILFYLTDRNVFTVFFHEAKDADRETAIKARDNLAKVVRQLASQTEPAGDTPKEGG
jgi:hypothetical protein